MFPLFCSTHDLYDPYFRTKSMDLEPFLRSHQLHTYSRISQHFMEYEGSLPCSEEPFTGPYPEPDQSSLRSILILSSNLLGVSDGLFWISLKYPVCT
jgi:hypothetical protein